MTVHMKAIFYKEFRILRNKMKSYLFSIGMFFIFLTSVSLYLYRENISGYLGGIIMYVQVYTGVAGFMYALRFWEEKITGTMELSLAGDYQLKELILVKNAFYLMIGCIISLIAAIILEIITGSFGIKEMIYALILYVIIIYPYGIINGVCMWCYKSGVGKFLQYTSLILIFSSFGLLRSITPDGVSDVLLYGIFFVCLILWGIAIGLLLLANKEKAVLSDMD